MLFTFFYLLLDQFTVAALGSFGFSALKFIFCGRAMFLGHASRKASWAGSLVLLYVKLLLLFEVRGFYLISWMDSALDAEDVLIGDELCALLILLGLGLALAGLEGLLCGLVVS